MRFPTMWYVRPAKPQISLRSLIRAFSSPLHILLIKLLTEHHLEFLSLRQGTAQAPLSLHLSKCHIVGNLMLWLIFVCKLDGSIGPGLLVCVGA